MVDVAGSIGSVVSPVLQVGPSIWCQFKYLLNYNTNFDNLRKEVNNLKNARDEVQRKVTNAERNVEEIKQNVKDWQKNVNKTITEAERLITEMCKRCARDHYRMVTEAERNVQEVEQELKDWHVDKTITEAEPLIQEKANNRGCFKGFCPNFIFHYQQSKKAFKLKWDDIDLLLQKEKEWDTISNPPPDLLPRPNKDYVAFESRNSIVTNVWEALKNENVYMVGVYGMGGLGKTTLVQELRRKATEEKKPFTEIVFVEVSESPDVKKIQTTIAEELGLEFKQEIKMADKIYSRMKDKNILLILDNIWEPLQFEQIGIPYEDDRGRNKLLFTTRDLNVLNEMGCTNNFRMDILNEEEAWTLFTKMAGNIIQKHELHSLQNDVCKECGGLPLVISAIAKALRNKCNPSDWKCALQELKGLSEVKYTRFLEKEYMKIALSYKYLSDELKKTFLISSLMENNTSISDFFRHVVCLNILGGVNLTMEGARDRLDKLVYDLKDACLLLDGFENDQFAMHDVIRAVAIIFAHEEYHVFTTRNDVERDWKDKDKLKKCTKISLPGKSTIISQLWPNNLDCPNLEYLYMTDMWNSSFKIPEGFFTVMPKLRVLSLVRPWLMSLPSSIHHLTNLQTLCLDNSNIKGVTVIGKLNELKVLSLRGSHIKEFPTEMGQLTQLRLLDLSYCYYLKVIAPNVISKLSNLEELYLKKCPIQWEIEVLRELKLLSNLTSVELDIENHRVLPEDFFSRELIRYKISIGNWRYNYPTIGEQECLRILKLIFNPTIQLEELCGIKNVELLCFGEYLDDEDEDDLEHSKFNLQSNEMTPLFNKKVIFLDLKVFRLKNIISRKIWDNQLPSSSFQNLKELTLWRCTKIKFVFPYTMTKNLQQLQYLEIKDCIDLEEIVATEEITEAAASFVFPQVTVIKLGNLPELATFCRGIHTSEWPKLKKLAVKDCDKFKLFNSEPKSLCLDQKINHDLEIFQLQNGWEHIIWGSQSKELKIFFYESAYIPLWLLQRFENLTCLFVDDCNKLVNLTTLSTARSLVHLRELNISYCAMLMEILETEEDATTEIVFENLNKLSFDRMKSLMCFCSGNYTFNFPSLEKLNIANCPNMMTFCRGILSTPKLQKISYEKMKVENDGNDLNKTIQGLYKKKNQDISLDLNFKCKAFHHDNSMEIGYNQHSTSFYQNLTYLFLWKCRNIKYAFPSSIAKSLHQLQQLEIQNCQALEGIVAKEDGTNTIVDFVFPNITLLGLKDLPELTTFYPGIYTLEMPKLKVFVVKDCTKIVSLKENNVETKPNILDPKSIFVDNKINFNSEVFELYDGETNVCWQSQSKTLTITEDISALLRLLQRFENVRELQLYCSLYSDIKSLCDLPNLEILEVDYCCRLMSLVPFSGSFQNLKVLKVNSCDELMKLITPSMSRSLMQLRELSVTFCGMLIEIVENEGDATRSTEIVFNNLNKLSLEGLNSFTSFCSGNYSFSFPSLKELIIEDCPNLEIFCQRSICTPKLDKVIYKFEDENVREIEIGDNDLNTTIQQEYRKKYRQK
ncbi:disease resistance protein At4g27190-like isoform X2 [Mangifera indica]|uniref:disease resistance protein At4g27190-like isoform X2 n=1 Tax=Mangifera indica TaxID=29780 RepID=UPI001CFA4A11|nr:disease resistance protein At4g27190-like isoform X2 [Mangifera indica]